MADAAVLSKLVAGLGESAWALAALAAAAECGLVTALQRRRSIASLSADTRVPEPIVRGLIDVLAQLGLATLDGDDVVAAAALAAAASDAELYAVVRDDLPGVSRNSPSVSRSTTSPSHRRSTPSP